MQIYHNLLKVPHNFRWDRMYFSIQLNFGCKYLSRSIYRFSRSAWSKKARPLLLLYDASKVSTKDIFLFQSAIPSHPLNFAGLSSFCNDVNAINEEFAGIPQVSGKIDELPPGAEVKNRYANVIPLPETRVQLQKLNNDPLTEYINASYVRVRSLDWNWFRGCHIFLSLSHCQFSIRYLLWYFKQS